MEINHQEVTTPPRPAATVILLRQATQGLEVFLLKRSGLSDVLGGAYVFPGGKLDAADSDAEVIARIDTPPAALAEALAEEGLDPVHAAALHVAAARETFEECGILLTRDATHAIAQDAGERARQGKAFSELLTELDLHLSLSSLVPWSRWITPRMPSVMNKRFDTRFFVAAVPDGLVASHDNRETTESAWLSPRTALDQYWSREIELAPPQIMTLAHLCRFDQVDAVLAYARSRRPPLIQPEPFQLDGLRTIAYPGDERHPIPARAMPGPTRLSVRDGRFEPLDGYEAFFR